MRGRGSELRKRLFLPIIKEGDNLLLEAQVVIRRKRHKKAPGFSKKEDRGFLLEKISP